MYTNAINSDSSTYDSKSDIVLQKLNIVLKDTRSCIDARIDIITKNKPKITRFIVFNINGRRIRYESSRIYDMQITTEEIDGKTRFSLCSEVNVNYDGYDLSELMKKMDIWLIAALKKI